MKSQVSHVFVMSGHSQNHTFLNHSSQFPTFIFSQIVDIQIQKFLRIKTGVLEQLI